MKLYVVGGAVRDALLGHPAADRDWVAVGATPEEMVALGYKPVGKDFPVFLDPQTGEEVALARTERKSGRGYRGFVVQASPEVTLEEDLGRRDLTINAIAQAEDGTLIDPHGGQRDIEAGVLRHVSPAFVEDPVRLLRVARLAARFPSFSLAPETAALLLQMVSDGEVDALVPERVWQELSRGLMALQPSRMVAVLQACAAWPRLLPGVPVSEARQQLLDTAANAHAPLPVRWALLVREGEHAAVAERLRVPNDCRELAALLAREQATVQGPALDAEHALQLFERCDALRRPERFALLLQACALDRPDRPVPELLPLLQVAREMDTAAVAAVAAAQGQRGPAIGAAVRAARVAAVQQRLAA